LCNLGGQLHTRLAPVHELQGWAGEVRDHRRRNVAAIRMRLDQESMQSIARELLTRKVRAGERVAISRGEVDASEHPAGFLRLADAYLENERQTGEHPLGLAIPPPRQAVPLFEASAKVLLANQAEDGRRRWLACLQPHHREQLGERRGAVPVEVREVPDARELVAD